jgi:uncharacterized protein RhaS with RHS repeats
MRIIRKSQCCLAATLMLLTAASAALAHSSQDVTWQPAEQSGSGPWAPTSQSASASTNGSVSVSYTYDSLGRLIQEAYPANTSGYTYDATGNRTQATTR